MIIVEIQMLVALLALLALAAVRNTHAAAAGSRGASGIDLDELAAAAQKLIQAAAQVSATLQAVLIFLEKAIPPLLPKPAKRMQHPDTHRQ